jgi:hypothetical protein
MKEKEGKRKRKRRKEARALYGGVFVPSLKARRRRSRVAIFSSK